MNKLLISWLFLALAYGAAPEDDALSEGSRSGSPCQTVGSRHFTDEMLQGFYESARTLCDSGSIDDAINFLLGKLVPQRRSTGGTLSPSEEQAADINAKVDALLGLKDVPDEEHQSIVKQLFPETAVEGCDFLRITKVSELLSVLSDELPEALVGYYFLFDIDETLMTRVGDNHILIDPETNVIFERLKERGATLLAFTNRSIDSNAETRLSNLGVVFKSLSGMNNDDGAGRGYKNGILYSGGQSKGAVLTWFLQREGVVKPSHIVMVDDTDDHLKTVEKASGDLKIPCTCILINSNAHQETHIALGAADRVGYAAAENVVESTEDQLLAERLKNKYGLSDENYNQSVRWAREAGQSIEDYLASVCGDE